MGITIMLGTNDAKDPDDHGPDNWQHDCSSPAAHTDGCSFAASYKDMVDLVRTLGTTAGVAPKVYGLIPPALMEPFAYGMNQTVINSVFPDLVPIIAKDNKLDGTIDVFSGMGGVSDWHDQFPHKCTLRVRTSRTSLRASLVWRSARWRIMSRSRKSMGIVHGTLRPNAISIT